MSTTEMLLNRFKALNLGNKYTAFAFKNLNGRIVYQILDNEIKGIYKRSFINNTKIECRAYDKIGFIQVLKELEK